MNPVTNPVMNTVIYCVRNTVKNPVMNTVTNPVINVLMNTVIFSSILIAEVRQGHPGCKILHHCLTPYPEKPHSAIWNIFKKYPETLEGLKPKPQSEQPFPFI